jgi:hypothetical protein
MYWQLGLSGACMYNTTKPSGSQKDASRCRILNGGRIHHDDSVRTYLSNIVPCFANIVGRKPSPRIAEFMEQMVQLLETIFDNDTRIGNVAHHMGLVNVLALASVRHG